MKKGRSIDLGSKVKVNINAGKNAGTSYYVGRDKKGRFINHQGANNAIDAGTKAVEKGRKIRARRKKVGTVLGKIKALFTITFCGFLLALAIVGTYQDKLEAQQKTIKPVTVVRPRVVQARELDRRPTVTPTPTPAPQPPTVEEMITSTFGAKASQAIAVATCESHLKSVKSKINRNGTYDYGIFQINSIHLASFNVTPAQLLDPATNIKIAYTLYQAQGWQPWYSSRACHHLK